MSALSLTPGDELRLAAAHLRNGKPLSHGKHWFVELWGDGKNPGPQDVMVVYEPDWPVAEACDGSFDERTRIATWIALMSPALAEPLADLLEMAAHMISRRIHVHEALIIARAINKGAEVTR